jgi:hypothetical protein
MFRTWWQKFFSFPRTRLARRRGYRPPSQLLYRTTRLSMTALEDRITPAFNMTLSLNATVGVNESTVGATTTFTATASGANVSWQDVDNSLAAGNSVVINSGSSGTEAGNITDQTGAQLGGLSGNQSLALQSGTGTNLVGNISIHVITLQGSNESISISAAGSVTADFLSAGLVATPTALTSATITAANGSIAGGPIFATNAALTANTGIGTTGSALSTQFSNLVAQTAVGGIFVNNTGALNIGFAGDPFQGVTVNGASGAIQVVTSGSMTVSEPVTAPGSVTLNATGATSNLSVQAGFNGVLSIGAAVTLDAGQNLILGTATAPGAVEGQGIVLEAGGNIVVDNSTIVNADGAAGIQATAGGDFEMLHVIQTTSRLSSNGSGPISIQTGAGHTFTLDAGAGGAIATNGGNITISADDMVINDGINTNGAVILQQAGTIARPIDIGLGTTANRLALTTGELNLIGAGSLVIGRVDNAGDITLTAPSVVTRTNTLTLKTAGSIIDGTNGFVTPEITVANLTMNAGVAIGAAGLGNIDFAVVTLNAGRTNGAAGVNMFLNEATGSVAVGQIDAGAGNIILNTLGGPITGISPNDGVADVIGNNVTLDAQLATGNGNTGQIGFFTTSAQFFEVQATTLTALTNNSRMWVSAIGGAALSSVNAGTNTAFLRTVGGDLTSTHTGATPDITAAALNLSQSGTSGEFGTAANPLLTQTSSLTAKVSAGPGSINVSNVAAGGNLAVAGAATVSGSINLTVAGGNLTTTATAGTDISAPGSIVTLTASGAVVSGATPGVIDVSAGSLALITGTGVGTALNPLKTTVTNLAFLNNATNSTTPTVVNAAIGNAVVIANTGPLTINAVGGIAKSANLGTTAGATTTLSAASPMTFAVNTTSAGTLTATATETNDPGVFADKLTVNAGITVESTGGNVVLQAGDDVVLNTGSLVKSDGGSVTLTAAFNDVDNEGGISMAGGTVQAGTDISLSARNTIALGTLTAGAGVGTVTINSTVGGATEAASGAITGLNLLLLGAGTFTLTQPGNNVADIAANVNGAIAYTDSSALTVNSVNGTNGITATGATLRATNALLLSQPINVGAGTAILQSTAAGIIDGNGATNNVVAGNLAMEAAAGIGDGDAIETQGTGATPTNLNLAFNNTGGAVAVANTGPLTIVGVSSIDGTSVLTGSDNTGTTTTLSAASPMTFAANTTSAGTLTATTADNGAAAVDNITVNSTATVQSTAGDVIFHAGDDVVVNGTVKSTFRDVDLVAGFGDTDGEGIITITGTVSAVATVALNVNATNAALPADTPIANESATGTITAAGLLLLNSPAGAPGEFSLDSSTTNSVGTIAAATKAEVDYRNSGALTVGTVTSVPEGVTSFGIFTTNHDVTLCTVTGDISLTQALNVGTGMARLAAGGAATQTAAGGITAADLGVTAAGNIGLDQAVNTVPGTVALNSSGGSVAFMETAGFTVGTITASDCFPGATGISGTGDITLCSGVNLILAAPLDTTGTVRLQAGGTVTQTAAGTITAANLGVRAVGTIGLCVIGSPNTITGTFAADNSGAAAGTTIMFLDGTGYSVGTITASGCFMAAAVGVTTNDGDIDLVNTAGSFAYVQPINAGTENVRINSAGAVTQDTGGAAKITAGNLAVRAAGTINLGAFASPNAVTGNFAAADSAAGAAIQFLDGVGFTVGMVIGDACAVGATGAVSTNGDIDLVAFGPITLAQGVNAGTGTVRLTAVGALTQSVGGAGAITAQNLAVVANGNIDLSESANSVGGTFAGLNNTAGDFIRFLDMAGFTVGTVAGDGFANGATGVNTTAGDISFNSTAGPITLLQGVSTATPNLGVVRINSGGAVTQAAGGAGSIIALNLAVVANGVVNLCVLPNTVNGTFAAADSANGASVMFLDADGFTVGTIAADPAALGATGVVTTNGDIDLVSTAGPIVLTQAVIAGTATVRINSGAAVTQTIGGAGKITAGNLAVVAAGAVNLCQVPNTVTGAFAALDTGAGASVMFNDTAGITVGLVAADSCAVGATGAMTNNGDIDLVSNGSITFPNSLSAGTGTVRLNAGTTIAQSGGTVTAQSLAAVANGTVDLASVANAVSGTFAALDTANLAAVRFLDGPGFIVGTVMADTCAAGATGVKTTNGDATLVSNTGSIQVQQAIATGTGTTRLQAATGIVSTATTGTITAASLGVRNTTSGDIQLDQANAVPVFAAFNGTAGAGINFADTVALSLDAVSADGTLFAGVSGVFTTGAGGTVRLQTAGLSQTANGVIMTDLLGVQNTAGNVILDQPNVLNTFAANNTAAAGRVTLRAANSLVLGTVGGQGTFVAVNGVATNAGTTFLQAAGNVTQTAVGLVNSQSLAVNSTVGGTIRLDQGNTVATFAAEEGTVSGLINFRTVVGLTLDTVTSGSALLLPVAGVSTRAGTTLLHAANGITQTAAGLINSTNLAVRNDTTGDISLLQTNYLTIVGNQVGTFAGVNGAPGGRLDFATLGALTLGTVAGDGTFVQVRGITTNNGESNLQTGTDFTAVDTNFASPLISLGSGNFLLNPGQTGNSIVTFNAEAQTTGSFRLGVPQPTDAPPPPPPGPPMPVPNQTPLPANPAGPAGNVLPANFHRDTFNVRPSANVQILVNGNNPTTAPGDTLNLILTDLPANASIRFTPGGVGSGRFDFPNTRFAVPFTGIETVGGLNVLAAATQTGPNTYTITASGTIQGRMLFGGITGGQVPANPFIVSPNPVNPAAPFGAPRIAFGDFNGDGVTDLILGNGPANAPLVTVIDGKSLFGPQHALVTKDLVSQFFAYNPNFQGGLFVAAGDLNGDGRAEIITGADQGGGPHVNAFQYTGPAPSIDGTFPSYNVFNSVGPFSSAAVPVGGFYAYNPAFTGGVRVAVGDVNGDGTPDIITGTGPGGAPHVEVFNGATGKILDSFNALAANFRGGIYVGAGDYNLDGKADIIVGAGAGGPEVRVFNGADLIVLTQFYAFGPDGPPSLFGADLGNTTGIGSVAIADVNGDGLPDIIVASNRGPRTRIAAFLGNGLNPPPHIAFTTATNPNSALFTVDPDTGDLITLSTLGLRDGSNVAGLFGKS